MGTVVAICAVMALATFAPEIFEKMKEVFKFIVHKLKSAWKG
jgi:hypothetical protein